MCIRDSNNEAIRIDASQNATFDGNTTVTGVLYTDVVQTRSGTSIDFRHQDASVIMRIDTDDARVGIGTTTPDNLLDVVVSDVNITPNTESSAVFRRNGNNYISILSNSSNWGGILFGEETDANDGALTYDHPNGNMVFETRDAERMRITSAGNVGIGTTSPGTNLQVNSSTNTATSIGISNTGSGASRLYMDASNGDFSGSDYMWIGQNDDKSGEIFMAQNSGSFHIKTQPGGTSTTQFTVTQAGNVGIGTSLPLSKLHIDSSEAAVHFTRSGQETYRIIHGSSGLYFSKPNSGALAFGVTQNSDFDTFDSSGNTLFRSDASTGRVGIGTTSPTYDLSVNGAISGSGFVTYAKSYGSLTTTGNAVAGITTGSNGASCGFTFTCFGGTGKYQTIVYSCYNDSGTWRPKKVIDEGTNDLDVTASADGATITFTFKARSSSQSYTPRVKVEADGQSINSTYA